MPIDVTATYDGSTIVSLAKQTSVDVKYGSTLLFTLSAAGTKTLTCKDKVMNANVTVGSKTLPCKDKMMSTNVVVKATKSTYTLIDGKTLTGSWGGKTIQWAYSASNVNKRAPTKSTSGSQTRLTQAKATSSMYQGAYATTTTHNLTGYTKLVLKYDIVTTGTVADVRLLRVSLFAGKSMPTTYQSDATYSKQTSGVKAGNTLTNQTLSLTITGGTGFYVGIGLNQSNGDIGGYINITSLHAE